MCYAQGFSLWSTSHFPKMQSDTVAARSFHWGSMQVWYKSLQKINMRVFLVLKCRVGYHSHRDTISHAGKRSSSDPCPFLFVELPACCSVERICRWVCLSLSQSPQKTGSETTLLLEVQMVGTPVDDLITRMGAGISFLGSVSYPTTAY